jgi:hypothetical protein
MKRLALATGMMIFVALPVAALAQEAESVTLKAGTPLEVRLMTTLSTRTNKEGDPWSGKLVESIIHKGEDVIPVGSIIEGRVTFAKEAGRVKGKAEMRLVAESITTPQDVKYVIIASLEEARGMGGAKVKDKEGTIEGGGTSAKGGAIEAGVGAGGGAAIGGLAAGGTGAMYGAGIGLVAAGLHHLFKRGQDVTLPIGTELTFVISRDSIAQVVKAAGPAAPEAEPGPPILRRDEAGPKHEKSE